METWMESSRCRTEGLSIRSTAAESSRVPLVSRLNRRRAAAAASISSHTSRRINSSPPLRVTARAARSFNSAKKASQRAAGRSARPAISSA